jgi:glycosyltransferase involved in cell wall biosynthesis
MRVLLWHGWLLDGTGSNVYTARVAEELAAQGHDVILLCQERHPERHPWIDAVGMVGTSGVSGLTPNAAPGHAGRCILLRPDIGRLLPVFVLDEYEGFDVKSFVDLADAELDQYLSSNVHAVRAAVAWQGTDAVIAGHAFPGGIVAKRAVGPGSYVTTIHGSDLEYAVRPQMRYRELAREGLQAAAAVAGSSRDVLDRCMELVPDIQRLVRVVHPGVDATRFHPRPAREALRDLAARLDVDPDTGRGRPSSLDEEVWRLAEADDGAALDALAHAYDQTVPDPDAADRLLAMSARTGPIVGYFGKLIPQKGVTLLLAALTRSVHRPSALVVGFGLERERLAALVLALRAGDERTIEWLLETSEPRILRSELGGMPLASDVTFTGRLDHGYAPDALAAMDVLVVPSVLPEAFGMVAAEGAAAGVLPLVARHSGLAEVAAVLESLVGRPGLFSFEPGPIAVRQIAAGIDRLLRIPGPERQSLRDTVRAFIAQEWSWRRTAERLLDLVQKRFEARDR